MDDQKITRLIEQKWTFWDKHNCFWHMRGTTWVDSMLCNIVGGETIMELQYLCVTICWFIETCKSRCTLSWFTQCWIVVYSLLGPFVFFVWISTSKTMFRKFVGTNCVEIRVLGDPFLVLAKMVFLTRSVSTFSPLYLIHKARHSWWRCKTLNIFPSNRYKMIGYENKV